MHVSAFVCNRFRLGLFRIIPNIFNRLFVMSTLEESETSRESLPEPKRRRITSQTLTDNNIQLERAVGMSEYFGKAKGFNGLLKVRYSDFLVNEVTKDGHVLHLTDLTAPTLQASTSNESFDLLKGLIGEQKANELHEFVHKTEDKKTAQFTLGAELDKEKRTNIHKYVKLSFRQVYTETIDGAIVVRFNSNSSRNRIDDWPSGMQKYVEFSLYKENKDSHDCLNLLAKMLGIKKVSIFSVAGTKDKRAVTVQRVRAFRTLPSRLAGLNSRLRGIRLGNFSMADESLCLGDLGGNRFTITIRNVDADEQAVTEAVEEWKTLGFINYFGMQRFGIGMTPTHMIGIQVLKRDWQQTIQTIMQPIQGDFEEYNRAREHFIGTGNIEESLQMIPSGKMHNEKKILLALKKCGSTAYYNAFASLPRTLRLMYLHAYQSWIWNRMVSKRLQLSRQVLVGDFVYDGEVDELEDVESVVDSMLIEEEESSEGSATKSSGVQKVRVVTEDEINKYSLLDIVLPLPGFAIEYPPNMKEFYSEALANDGITNEHFIGPNKEYQLPGRYRKVIGIAKDVEWKMMHYDDIEYPLSRTDLDVLQNLPPPVDLPHGKYTALVISFTLNSATYATVCLRELLKRPTSFAHDEAQATIQPTPEQHTD